MAALCELPAGRPGLLAMTSARDSGAHDDALVRAAQAGDRAAFGLLYARYARMVHGMLLSRVPPRDAEDLLHDVFLQVLQRLASLRDVSRFPGWLAAIARNRAIDFHRRAKPDVSYDEESRAPGSEHTPSHPALPPSESSAQARAALEAIRSLPDAYRETLILRLVEGMTGPEIATRTGLTRGSVRVNLHRGMQQLREILERKPTHATGGDL